MKERFREAQEKLKWELGQIWGNRKFRNVVIYKF